ncbi:MAG: YicC family protein, partial [Hyphomicrobiales bacterium]
MPINSMTGFARVDGANAQGQWYWELRSVNGKGLDVRCRLPSNLDGFEQKVRAAVQKRIKRGNCQVSLQLNRERGVGELKVNDEALTQVVALLSQLSEKVDAAPARLDGLLSLKGVVEFVEPEESDEERENLSSALLASLDDTLSGLVEMRASEGAKLEELLVGQLDEIERLSIAARDCPARTVEAIQTRLSEQVAKLIEASTTLDAERLHQEAVLIAAKADIQEELDRLFA